MMEKILGRHAHFIIGGFLLLIAMMVISAVLIPASAAGEEPAPPEILPVNIFPNLKFELPTVIANAGDERLLFVPILAFPF